MAHKKYLVAFYADSYNDFLNHIVVTNKEVYTESGIKNLKNQIRQEMDIDSCIIIINIIPLDA